MYWSYYKINEELWFEIKKKIEVLSCLRDFINFLGKPVNFQFDNGPEFKNNESLAFFNNENIKVFFSAPYYPQSNVVIEAVHKEIQRYVSNHFVMNLY